MNLKEWVDSMSMPYSNLIKNLVPVFLEYIIEVGLDEVVKESVPVCDNLRLFSHLESYAKERGFI